MIVDLVIAVMGVHRSPEMTWLLPFSLYLFQLILDYVINLLSLCIGLFHSEFLLIYNLSCLWLIVNTYKLLVTDFQLPLSKVLFLFSC